MLRILLCAATTFEIQPTIDGLDELGGDLEVEVLITGVGMMETAWSLATRLAKSRPDYLIQAGIAGTLSDAHPVGSAALVHRDTVGDLGVWEGGAFRSTFSLGFGDPNEHPWQNGWLANGNVELAEYGLPVCDAITVNEISTSSAAIDHYRGLGAVAESMEGAAFHYAALRTGVAFLQLRAFSNLAGVRDKSQWQIGPAIAALNTGLQTILAKLI